MRPLLAETATQDAEAAAAAAVKIHNKLISFKSRIKEKLSPAFL